MKLFVHCFAGLGDSLSLCLIFLHLVTLPEGDGVWGTGMWIWQVLLGNHSFLVRQRCVFQLLGSPCTAKGSSHWKSTTLRWFSYLSDSGLKLSLLALWCMSSRDPGTPFVFSARNFQSHCWVALCLPGSWLHSEFNEVAELSDQGRVSPVRRSQKDSALVRVK